MQLRRLSWQKVLSLSGIYSWTLQRAALSSVSRCSQIPQLLYRIGIPQDRKQFSRCVIAIGVPECCSQVGGVGAWETYYLHVHSQKARLLSKLRDVHISAVGWDAEVAGDSTTGYAE